MIPTRRKSSVAAWAGVIAIIALCVHAFLPLVSKSKLARLQVGMSREAVAGLLGLPTKIAASKEKKPGAFGPESWHYEMVMRFAYMDVSFDAQGCLTGFNYEEF